MPSIDHMSCIMSAKMPAQQARDLALVVATRGISAVKGERLLLPDPQTDMSDVNDYKNEAL